MNKLKKDDPCPKCGGRIEWDLGNSGSYWEPPTPAWIGCSACDYAPEDDEIDHDSFHPYNTYEQR